MPSRDRRAANESVFVRPRGKKSLAGRLAHLRLLRITRWSIRKGNTDAALVFAPCDAGGAASGGRMVPGGRTAGALAARLGARPTEHLAVGIYRRAPSSSLKTRLCSEDGYGSNE